MRTPIFLTLPLLLAACTSAKLKPATTPTGEPQFTNLPNLYAYAANKFSLDPFTPDSPIILARDSRHSQEPFPPHGILHVLQIDMNNELRGIHGDTQILLYLETPNHLYIIVSPQDQSFGGFAWSLDPATAEFTTAWHDGANPDPPSLTYKFNGHRFTQLSPQTQP